MPPGVVPRLLEGVKGVGFDLDGTLIDSAPDLADAANEMLRALGMRTLPEPLVAQFIGDGVEELIRRSLQASGGTAADAQQQGAGSELFRRHYAAQLFHRSRVYPGVLTALTALREHGLTLCCLTNKMPEFAVAVLQAGGLHDLFDFTLSPLHAAERKPSAALLMRACERMQLSVHEFIYVGDSYLDVAAARAAGCRVVAVSYGYDRGAHAAAEADAVVGSLTELLELPRATH